MKKNIGLALLALTLIGCGGGGSDEKDKSPSPNDGSKSTVATDKGKTNGKYHLWEYVTPAKSKTNEFIETTSGGKTNSYKTTYAITQNSVTEISDYAQNERTIYSKKSDRITISFEKDNTPNGAYDLDLTADVNDVVTVKESTCVLTKHYDSIKLGDKDFTDVLEIKCGDRPGYYQKGQGEIAQTKALGDDGIRSVRVLNN